MAHRSVPLPKFWESYTLEEWLYYLENNHQKEVQLGLDRIHLVANTLNLLKPKSCVITVAGTNGKGSSVAALEAIYMAAGFKTGTYTSPHLLKFNERIRVQGNPIKDEELKEAFCVVENARANTHLTYFEMTTLAAIWHFERCALDVMILEVGLGGRLDATNIIDADAALITTIDFDHQEYLGSTLNAIAKEKAGILRKGQPAVYADVNPPASIAEEVNQKKAVMHYFGCDYTLFEKTDTFLFEHKEDALELPKPAIHLQAAGGALMVSRLLNHKLPVKVSELASALENVHITGRLELIEGRIPVLYDVSHNPQSVRLLKDKLDTIYQGKTVHAVFSALKDKPLTCLVSSLKGCVSRWFPAQLDNPRAASEDMLMHAFKEASIDVACIYSNPLLAFQAAVQQAAEDDLIIVYGSFFTVAAIYGKHFSVLTEQEIS
jgi:dihydrofolate synthase/folylpolyglutamate synthase